MTGKRRTHEANELYLTRAAALKKLQMSLSSFRKLCILKGVYPREPKKNKNPNKVYYLKKDIMFLYHDPIVEKLREQKIFHRKMKRAEGLKDRFQLIQLKLKFPNYSLDHIMRERYPTFGDAVRDLDDALSLIVLIAQLPQTDLLAKPRIIECERLYNEFESWVAKSQTLKKVFVSVKGIYYQAEIEGIPVTWLSPHENAGSANSIDTSDVNIKILLNFVELYEALMGFVLYKLYHNIGLRYPPLASLEVLKKTDVNKVENEEILLDYYVATMDSESQKQEEKKLFSGLVFYISREVPRHSLYFAIRSLGGTVLFKEADENDERITHHIVDRNSLKKKFLSRMYVQPQWIYDSINEKKLLKTLEYAPGANLPPHLSPFVDDSTEGYVPERREQLLKFANNEAEAEANEDAEEEEQEQPSNASEGKSEKAEDDDDPNVPKELESEFQIPKFEEENPNEELEEDYQKGIEAELKGEEYKPEPKKAKKSVAETLKAKKKLASVVLTAKKNKFYQKMVDRETKKEEKQAKLQTKRKVADQLQKKKQKKNKGEQ